MKLSKNNIPELIYNDICNDFNLSENNNTKQILKLLRKELNDKERIAGIISGEAGIELTREFILAVSKYIDSLFTYCDVIIEMCKLGVETCASPKQIYTTKDLSKYWENLASIGSDESYCKYDSADFEEARVNCNKAKAAVTTFIPS